VSSVWVLLLVSWLYPKVPATLGGVCKTEVTCVAGPNKFGDPGQRYKNKVNLEGGECPRIRD
jgi:hypothetical protein